jgi:endonuclease/exonuclease/phosphatase family metal-dependent hydrolase
MKKHALTPRPRHLALRPVIAFAAAAVIALVMSTGHLKALPSSGGDTIAIAQYNTQFLFPAFVPTFVLEAFNHFPDSSERATLIGQVLACRDIVSLNEVSNDDRRADIFAAMEANAANCGRAPLVDGGTRFWDFFVGPHNSQTDPVLDDEIAIASRFPITQVHTLVYTDCTAEDCFADKGALHARLWRGPGHHGRDALDVFITHTNNGDNGVLTSQLEELKGFIQAHHDPEIPAIVMGDFNIAGNPSDVSDSNSLYNTMINKLREALPNLQDMGNPANPTNMEEDSRIDFVLVNDIVTEPVQVDYFKDKFPGVTDPDLPHDGRLSDHAALLTTAQWATRGFPANPPTTLPRELHISVSRLEEITPDVPGVAIVPVIITLPTPIGLIPIPFPVAVGCDGLTDHFGNLQFVSQAGPIAKNFDEDQTFEGDDITPAWSLGTTLAPGVADGSLLFALFDDDDLVCGGGNDTQDINPFSDDFDIGLGINFAADGIFHGATQLAKIGEPIFLKGTDSDDRARATLFIETRYSSTADSDGDGLSDAAEAYTHGTNPEDADSDDDGLADGAEVNTHHTNPLDPDTDDDGLSDGDEVNVHHTDPLVGDTDNDGLKDGDEITYGADPHDPDTDDDQLRDGEEVHTYHTSPTDADTDDDGLTDGQEVLTYGTDPLDPDTDDDELMDGLEVQASTNPLDSDTDDDGIKDGEDVEFIENIVNGLPASAFDVATLRDTLVTRLEAIENSVAQGQRQAAISDIAKLRLRLDGCGAIAEKDDWIVDCTSQQLVRGLLDLLANNLAN